LEPVGRDRYTRVRCHFGKFQALVFKHSSIQSIYQGALL
jgi:hypothetical protein